MISITHVLFTIGNPEVRQVVDSVVSEALTTLFEWQPALCNAVITKALHAQQASVAAKAAREMVSCFTFFLNFHHHHFFFEFSPYLLKMET